MRSSASERSQGTSSPSHREPLALSLSSIQDVASIIDRSSSIVVLTGAGISVSCGLPDFRSKGGIYQTLREKYNLADPQVVFDIHEFHNDPQIFYSFAKHIMPSPSLKPSITHEFISQLASQNKLLRNYSQNLDGLENKAGVPLDKLVLCHGSFLSATCTHRKCRTTVPGKDISSHILNGEIPYCLKCTTAQSSKHKRRKKKNSFKKSLYKNDSENDDDDNHNPDIGMMKPDIVFFGERISLDVQKLMQNDILKADLVLVMGTSLKIEPVSKIPHAFPDPVPRILINREPVNYDFDVELLGNCDTIIKHLCSALNGDDGENTSGSIKSNEYKNMKDSVHKDWIDDDGNTNCKSENNSECNQIRFVSPRRFIFDG